MDDLDARLKTVFQTCLRLPPDDAGTAAVTRANCPAWDSMAHLNLILVIEQTFEISLSDDEVATVASFAEMLSLVQTLVSSK